MVQPILDQLLDAGEIDDHAILVQRLGLAINRDDPIMPMKVLALAGIRQVQAMGGRYFDSLRYIIHNKLIT